MFEDSRSFARGGFLKLGANSELRSKLSVWILTTAVEKSRRVGYATENDIFAC